MIQAIAAVMLLSSVCTYAQKHYIRVNADVAYARDMARGGEAVGAAEPINLSAARAIIGSGQMQAGVSGNGFAPALGVGYRLSYNHLLFDVGIGAEYRQTHLHPTDLTNVQQSAVDEEGMTYVGHHAWTNRSCKLSHVGVNIPVMIGGEWSNICVLAGVKANVDIWGSNTERGNYSLVADYERYMDPFSNMPNHGFVQNEPYECAPVAQSMAFNLRACAEVGYCVYGADDGGRYRRSQSPLKCYVSAFGEYSVLATQGTYSPLLVGVRATMLVALPEKRQCTCSRF